MVVQFTPLLVVFKSFAFPFTTPSPTNAILLPSAHMQYISFVMPATGITLQLAPLLLVLNIFGVVVSPSATHAISGEDMLMLGRVPGLVTKPAGSHVWPYTEKLTANIKIVIIFFIS